MPLSAPLPPRAWADGAWPLATAVSFLVMVVCNAASGSRNAAVSAAHRTAFTPAGWAFSVWGLIYTLGATFVVWQAAPSPHPT